MNLLMKAVPGVLGIFKSRSERKADKDRFQHEENLEEGRRITNLDENDAAYAIAKLKEQQGTWKDEVALITVLIPAWLAFIKVGSLDGPAIVKAGMEALAGTPIWYQSLLTGAITAALGMNEYAKHKKRVQRSLPSGERTARSRVEEPDASRNMGTSRTPEEEA